MTDAARSTRLTSLGSDAPGPLVRPAATRPGAYAAPARFLDLPDAEELAILSQIAAQLLNDPLAVQQLSDRVVELLQQEIRQERERSRGYGRRY